MSLADRMSIVDDLEFVFDLEIRSKIINSLNYLTGKAFKNSITFV